MFLDREGVLSRARYTQAYTMFGLVLSANIFSLLASLVWHEHRATAIALGLVGWPATIAILGWAQWQENKTKRFSESWKGASREAPKQCGLILLTARQAIETCGQLAVFSAPIFCAALVIGSKGFLWALLAYVLAGPLWFEIHREFLGRKWKGQPR